MTKHLKGRKVVFKLDEILTMPVHPFAERNKPMPVGSRPESVLPVVCKDGTTLSVQASKMHHCMPRNDQGPWAAVEVGFPSVNPPPSWDQYSAGKGSQVWSYVPVSMVREFIAAHGGEKE